MGQIYYLITQALYEHFCYISGSFAFFKALPGRHATASDIMQKRNELLLVKCVLTDLYIVIVKSAKFDVNL